MRKIVFAAAAWLAASFAAVAAEPPAPVARRVDVVDRAYGLEMPDPYRWMEGEAGHEELGRWLDAHGARTRQWLDARPTLPQWQRVLGRISGEISRTTQFQRAGSRLFFLKIERGGKAMLAVRDADGRERVAYDPGKSAGNEALSGFMPSKDGKRVAVLVGRAGSEFGELRVLDATTGRALEKLLSPIWGEFVPEWTSDGRGLLYIRSPIDGRSGKPTLLGSTLYLHRIGRAQADDRRIVESGNAGALRIAKEDFAWVTLPSGSPWAQLVVAGARATLRVCVADAAMLLGGRISEGDWRCLVDDSDNVQDYAVHGDMLYLRQAKGFPNSRVVALDLRDPDARIDSAAVVVPERDAAVQGIVAARDALYVLYQFEGISSLRRIDYRTLAARDIALPTGDGNVGFMKGTGASDGVTLSFESWTRPAESYEYSPGADRISRLGKGAPSPIDASAIEVERLQARSADGSQVPLTLIHRKDHRRDGRSLAIVMGYGGYGIGMQPKFDPMKLAWANAGHVYAICHVRGGDEKGDAWRTGGTGPNKQRGVEDFVACAKTLADRGDSSPRRTGALSASMGGVLLGGAYVTAPDAFGAMAITAGILNTTRLEASDNGPNQYQELGDPRTEAGMRQLLAMDPYQRVRDGQAYPALLFGLGLADQRVDPWHSAKFAARIMAASPETLVLIRTHGASGHFETSGQAAATAMADYFATFESILGAD